MTRQDSDQIGPTHAIADHLSSITFSELPDEVVANAKLAILDTLGVMTAGSRSEPGRAIIGYIAAAGGREVATVCASAHRTSPEYAALANGVLAHALEFDDRGHASSHVLPAVLAVGEAEEKSGRELLVAYVVGRELRQHLDDAFRSQQVGDNHNTGGPRARGWHEAGVVGSLGSAAACSHMLSLGTSGMKRALGIAASLASGLIANSGTSTKPLHAGNAARNGIIAGYLAREGFSSEPEILSARGGYVEALCFPETRDMNRVAEELKTAFHISGTGGRRGLRVKPYPAASITHPYIEAAQRLRSRGINYKEVQSISVGRDKSTVVKRDYPRTIIEAKFDPAFATIATLITGTLSLDNCTDRFLASSDVQSLIRRTNYVETLTGEIQLVLKDGSSHREEIAAATFLTSPADIASKFRLSCKGIVEPERATAIEELVGRLDLEASTRSLTSLIGSGTEYESKS